MTNPEGENSAAFVIRYSSFFRHSSFDIRDWRGLLNQRQDAYAGDLGAGVDDAHVAVAGDGQVKGDILRTDVRLPAVPSHLQSSIRYIERAVDNERSITLDGHGLRGVSSLE